jgi:hypothetical protein
MYVQTQELDQDVSREYDAALERYEEERAYEESAEAHRY